MADSNTLPPAPSGSESRRSAGDEAPKYSAVAPRPQRLTLALLWQVWKGGWRRFGHFLGHTLSFFDPSPIAKADITRTAPGGTLDEKQVAVCEHLAASAEARLAKLEQKASTLLSVIVVVGPLVASAAVFAASQPLPAGARVAVLAVDFLALISTLLASIGVMRALAVRGFEELFLNTVIDPTTDTIRQYDPDFFGRGLLHTTAMRQAVIEHIADFIRAGQLFLWVGLIAAMLAGALVLGFVNPPRDSLMGVSTTAVRVEREVDSSLAATADRVARIEARYDSALSAIETRLDSLAQGPAKDSRRGSRH